MFFADMKFKREMKKGVAEVGLRVATEAELDGSAFTRAEQVRSMVNTGDLSGFLPLFTAAWQSKERTESGDRVWARLLVALEGAKGQGTEAALAAGRRLFEEQPQAASAGVYATQLVNRAYAIRGNGYADSVGQSQRSQMQELFAEAKAVLDRFEEEGPGDVLWLGAFETLNAGQVSGVQSYLDLHELSWRLDRADISALSGAGNMLLPRWHGTSLQDVEDFARRAAELTADEFGEGGYAAVYSYFGNISDNDRDDTECDVQRLQRGLRDLVERFPGQRMLNRAVRTASWAGLEGDVLRYFGAPLSAIDPWFWGAGDEETAIELAWRAYRYAREDQGRA